MPRLTALSADMQRQESPHLNKRITEFVKVYFYKLLLFSTTNPKYNTKEVILQQFFVIPGRK